MLMERDIAAAEGSGLLVSAEGKALNMQERRAAHLLSSGPLAPGASGEIAAGQEIDAQAMKTAGAILSPL